MTDELKLRVPLGTQVRRLARELANGQRTAPYQRQMEDLLFTDSAKSLMNGLSSGAPLAVHAALPPLETEKVQPRSHRRAPRDSVRVLDGRGLGWTLNLTASGWRRADHPSVALDGFAPAHPQTELERRVERPLTAEDWECLRAAGVTVEDVLQSLERLGKTFGDRLVDFLESDPEDR